MASKAGGWGVYVISRYGTGRGHSADSEVLGKYPDQSVQPRLPRGARIEGRALLPELSAGRRGGLMGVVDWSVEGDVWHVLGPEGSAP